MKYLYRFFAILFLPFFAYAVPDPEHRPSASPILSGDAFRSYCDYAFDEVDSSLNPCQVKPGSTIFVKGDMLKEFFTKVHPDIPCKYIIVSHNSDDSAPGIYKTYLDDERIIAWFALNYDGYPHPKMHPIPIGIATFNWGHGNFHTLKKIQEKKIPKEHLAYMNFTIQTFYEERWVVFKLFAQAPFCYRTMKKVFEGYLKDLAASKFSISPRGFGLDTHRLWESLYLHTIPIVKTSSLDSLYEGLPILIIPDWKIVNEEYLHQKYEEMTAKTYSLEKLYMGYWTQLIDSYKSGL